MTDTAREWRPIVDQVSRSTLAHAPEWLTVIRRAYGHDPLYFIGEDDEGHRAVLPAFVVRRPLVGTVVASMPFLDGGGPCSSSERLTLLMLERLVGESRRIGARAVDMRCTERLPIAAQPSEHKVNLVLSLPADPDRVWRQLDKGVRNQVRKAERSRLSVEMGGAEKLAAFYDIFAARMHDLGSPVHGSTFLRAVLDSFGARARIVLVRKSDVPIGGLVALAFKDSLIVPWAACRKDYFSLCPNMLLYWETIRTACTEGFGRFDFGRSSRHSGTYRFKRQWGAREEPLFWYTIPITARAGSPRASLGGALPAFAKAWRTLPLAVTRGLGPRIRKYLIQ